jgi:hypothetical protein
MNEKYLREIRNWARFGGILLIISVLAGVIMGIVVVKDMNTVVSPISTSCMSVGGSNPAC